MLEKVQRKGISPVAIIEAVFCTHIGLVKVCSPMSPPDRRPYSEVLIGSVDRRVGRINAASWHGIRFILHVLYDFIAHTGCTLGFVRRYHPHVF